jgi:hypothetical protein
VIQLKDGLLGTFQDTLSLIFEGFGQVYGLAGLEPDDLAARARPPALVSVRAAGFS